MNQCTAAGGDTCILDGSSESGICTIECDSDADCPGTGLLCGTIQLIDGPAQFCLENTGGQCSLGGFCEDCLINCGMYGGELCLVENQGDKDGICTADCAGNPGICPSYAPCTELELVTETMMLCYPQ
jgi:hypothetical protein